MRKQKRQQHVLYMCWNMFCHHIRKQGRNFEGRFQAWSGKSPDNLQRRNVCLLE